MGTVIIKFKHKYSSNMRAQHLPDRLKNLKEKIENSSFNKPTQQDKNKILGDIKKSQTTK